MGIKLAERGQGEVEKAGDGVAKQHNMGRRDRLLKGDGVLMHEYVYLVCKGKGFRGNALA